MSVVALLVLLAAAAPSWSSSSSTAPLVPFALEADVVRALHAHDTKHEANIPMRGGAKLHTHVWVPEPTTTSAQTGPATTSSSVSTSPGHRVMVQVRACWFPLIDSTPRRFVDIGKATEADVVIATQGVHRGGVKASKLTLRTLPSTER
jgi:predicted acyl esterase